MSKEKIAKFPHCDSSVLHAEGACEYCDMYPEWQALRRTWGINFTGESDPTKLPCPATARRPLETINKWGGNRAKPEVLVPSAPVDASATTTTDGQPLDCTPGRDGQQKNYVVLTEEERAKGFVRPVRRSYRHVGTRPKYPTRPLTPEENKRYAPFGYVAFEPYPESELPVTGKYWEERELNSGCGGSTMMSLALAETYARLPSFYSGTYCATCGAHFPVGENGEFVWEGTDIRVGT